MAKPKVHTEFDPPAHEGLETGPGLTKQSFRDECDINLVMEKYVPSSTEATVAPMFGDFSSAMEFQEAENVILEARAHFDALDSKVRERFQNNPAELLRFLEDPNNYEEAVRLGICEKRPEPAPPAPVPSNPDK